MVLLVVDTQKAITNRKPTEYCIDATVKAGFEHGFKREYIY